MSERKRSWREIDRIKDRGDVSDKRDERSSLERALEDPRLKERYLKEANRLFMGAKGGAGHSKDLRAIHETYGTAKFEAAVRRYLERYGLPDDWATLMLFLDFKSEPRVVIEAIDALVRLSRGKGLLERQGLKSKLKVLSLNARDLEIRDAAWAGVGEL
ncbi:MAG: hypothetical protein ACP5J5_00035 [Dissulfurimicrobium sp.]|nr:hypothetical protein [Dissulfurimicrobium hydrothermale]UKL14203.1 hypothetical protein LGS26_02840 [Dissulfurimicrobium hydrothermale]